MTVGGRRRRVLLVRLALLAIGFSAACLALCFFLARSRGVRLAIHPETPIRRGECVAWCAASQLSWDALADVAADGTLDLGSPAPADTVAAMNRRFLTPGDIDAASVAVAAGVGPPGPSPQQLEAFQELLGPDAPSLPAVSGKDTAYSFAALAKTLRFDAGPEADANPYWGGSRRTPHFERLDEPIRFSAGPVRSLTGTRVTAFGWKGGGAMRMEEKTSLLFRSPDGSEFALEVEPKEADERIVFARVEPSETLEGTWVDVAWRAARGQPVRLSEAHGTPGWPGLGRLAIPLIEFDREERFSALIDAEVRNARAKPARITEIREWVKFRVDERGADLKALSSMRMQLGSGGPPPMDFVFDRPFLVALRRANSGHPYFLLWVGGPDVLVKAP